MSTFLTQYFHKLWLLLYDNFQLRIDLFEFIFFFFDFTILVLFDFANITITSKCIIQLVFILFHLKLSSKLIFRIPRSFVSFRTESDIKRILPLPMHVEDEHRFAILFVSYSSIWSHLTRVWLTEIFVLLLLLSRSLFQKLKWVKIGSNLAHRSLTKFEFIKIFSLFFTWFF